MDYEIELITCCLLDNNIIDTAVTLGVQPEWFTNNLYQQIWTTSVDRNQKGQTVDTVWVYDFMKEKTGQRDLTFTDATHDVLLPKSEALSAIEIMKQDHQERQITDLLNNALSKVATEEPDLLVRELTDRLIQLQDSEKDNSEENIEEEISQELDRGIEYTTGFHELDYLVKGIEPGVLWVVGGFTSNGKTTFALNLGYNCADKGHPVTYFSTEMSKKLLIKRIATMRSGVNPSIAASLTDEEKECFRKELPAVLNLPIDVHCTLSLPEIRMAIRKRKSILYIVDYIQMIEPGMRFESEVRKLGYIVRELERLTKEYNVCIIATSQFNRAREEAPSLSSYRGSGEIEENTDIGILMYYPYQQAKYEDQVKMVEDGSDNIMNVMVKKNRIHGLTGTIHCEFDKRAMRMSELDELEMTT
ncbi:MAG: DnaB-like helicase C-terminal domain-containing protein [bacterium]